MTIATMMMCAFMIEAASAGLFGICGCDNMNSKTSSTIKGYEYCGKENKATCSVGCGGGRVWYGDVDWSGGSKWASKTLGPNESVECSNDEDGFGCDPYCNVEKMCYIEHFETDCCEASDLVVQASSGWQCKNNYNLGAFDCPIDCARAAATNSQCTMWDNTVLFMWDDYYSKNHASWGCRCCNDYYFYPHSVWELYRFDRDAMGNEPWLDAPSEALPKGMFEIVIDTKVALGALAVLALLSLNILLCLYRRCTSGRKGDKPVEYRNVEMVSSVDEAEPMM